MESGIIKLTPEMLAFIGTGGVNAISPFSREIFLLDIVVAGTTFCQNIDELEPLLVETCMLRMVRDPNNQYDEMAIGIYLDNNRVGWVPKELNLVISRLMDAGKAFFCRIEEVKRKNNWLKIDAKVYMVE